MKQPVELKRDTKPQVGDIPIYNGGFWMPENLARLLKGHEHHISQNYTIIEGIRDKLGAWLDVDTTPKISFTPDNPAVVTTGGAVTEYATIVAAIAAASSGQAVVLPPGTYDESITLKNGVMVAELFPGTATINSTTANTAVTTAAGGYIRVKEIKCTSTAEADTLAVTASHSSGNCYVLAELVQATNTVGEHGGSVYGIKHTGAGTLWVWADRIEGIGDYWDCAAAYIDAGTQYIYASRMSTTGTGEAYLYTAYVLGGTQYIWADRLEASGNGDCTAAYGGGGYPSNYQYIWADCIAASTGSSANGAYEDASTQEIHGDCIATAGYYAYGAELSGGSQKVYGQCTGTCTEGVNSYSYGAVIRQDSSTGAQEIYGNCTGSGGATSIGAFCDDTAASGATTQRINGDVTGDDYGAACEVGTQTITFGRASGATADLYQTGGTLQIYGVQYDTSSGTITHLAGDGAPSSAYTPTNVTTDRAFDADTVAVAELADVVGTLIADLQAQGILG